MSTLESRLDKVRRAIDVIVDFEKSLIEPKSSSSTSGLTCEEFEEKEARAANDRQAEKIGELEKQLATMSEEAIRLKAEMDAWDGLTRQLSIRDSLEVLAFAQEMADFNELIPRGSEGEFIQKYKYPDSWILPQQIAKRHASAIKFLRGCDD